MRESQDELYEQEHRSSWHQALRERRHRDRIVVIENCSAPLGFDEQRMTSACLCSIWAS